MDWIAELTAATDGFATELESGDLAASVPSCPGWSLADLGNHLREVHLWAAHAVAEGNPQGRSEPVGAHRLATAYREAADRLIAVLDVEPATPAWTFGPDGAVGFWQRRQVHETVVHLYDAILSGSHESEWAPSPELAWDGVEEVVTLFYPRQLRLGRSEPLAGPLRLTATDLDRSIVIGDGAAALTLAAPALDLMLTLWGRVPADDPEIAALLTTAAITP